ncbi:MAG: flagellar hook assembly protein FlgD [Kofleriaceae bacterium]
MSSTIDPTSSSTTQSSGPAQTQLAGSKDEFLKLFMAQLQHQDPLSPKDGSDMVAQLAQFSSVEQAQQTNQQLAALTASQNSTANAALSSLVGRQCNASLGDTHVENPNQIPPIEVSASGPIQGASIVVTDANGKEIRRIPVPSQGGAVQWDGKDASGNIVKPGDYNVAVDSGAASMDITANWQSKIDSVELSTTGSRLKMGGITLSPASITSIGAASSAATQDTITSAINAASSAGAKL